MGTQVAPRTGLVGIVTTAALDTRRDVIVLSHAHKRPLWLLLILVQVLSASLLAFFASIYFAADTPNSMLWIAAVYFVDADAYMFVKRNSVTIALGYTVLSVVFALNGMRLLRASLRHRELSFGTSMRQGLTATQRGPKQVLTSPTPASLHGRMARLREWTQRVGHAVSVHGPYFEVRQLASEIVALGSQTTAAYLASHSISNVGLNQTYGLVIFFNGISTLIYAKSLRQSRIKERFACLLTDVVLDFVWGSLLPLWMYVPIIKMFQRPLSEIRNDGESSVREMRRVFVLSWPAFLLSLVPFINTLVTIFEVQTILRDDTTTTLSTTGIGITGSAPHPSSMPTPQRQRHHQQQHRKWVQRAHGLLALYGCVMLGISLSAGDILGLVQQQPQYGCTFRLHPWFSTKEACIKRTIDCSVVGIGGNVSEMEAALDLLDESSLADVTFYGCDAFEMPRTLGRFSALHTIIIERSRIVDWSVEASLADDKIADVRILMLLEVQSNATLHGLVSVPIARAIEYIRFHLVPDAGTILAPIGDNWQHLIFFDCDRCNLTHVPSAVDAMFQMRTLSLVESHFSVLRDDYITKWDLSMMAIWMDGTDKLTELSDVVWKQAATCDMFSMQKTNLSVIPHWVASVAHSNFVVFAFATPLCDLDLIASAPVDVRKLVVCEFVDTNS